MNKLLTLNNNMHLSAMNELSRPASDTSISAFDDHGEDDINPVTVGDALMKKCNSSSLTGMTMPIDDRDASSWGSFLSSYNDEASESEGEDDHLDHDDYSWDSSLSCDSSLSSNDDDSIGGNESEFTVEFEEDALRQLQASNGSLYGLPKQQTNLPQDDLMVVKFFNGRQNQPLAVAQSPFHRETSARKPWEVLEDILGRKMESYPARMWNGYFLEVKKQHITQAQAQTTKDFEVVIPSTTQVDKMRTMIKSGNISRRLLNFLLEDPTVTARVRDDYGRSPLHDACWSYDDRFDIFKTLLEDSPDLLFVQDKKGYSPLDYIPKQRWEEWSDFLEKEADFLREALSGVDLSDMAEDYKKIRSQNACVARMA